MAGVNKVIIVGNLGQDPEIRYMPDGTAVANFSVATSDEWKDKQTGEKKERTEWHRIVACMARIGGGLRQVPYQGPSGLCGGQAANPLLGKGRRDAVYDGNYRQYGSISGQRPRRCWSRAPAADGRSGVSRAAHGQYPG